MEDELGSCLLGCLIQSVFHTEGNLSQPLLYATKVTTLWLPQVALCN